MKNILEQIAEKIADERAQWLDKVIKNNIPEWKLRFLLKHNNWLTRLFLNVHLEVISETLIASFGIRYVVKLNGKIIGDRKFKESINQISTRNMGGGRK